MPSTTDLDLKEISVHVTQNHRGNKTLQTVDDWLMPMMFVVTSLVSDQWTYKC